MIEKKKKIKCSTLNDAMVGLGVFGAMTGLMTNLLGGNKMFGENVPQGVIREIMQGVMDGLVTHFELQIDDLKRENERLKQKDIELDDIKEELDKLTVISTNLKKENSDLIYELNKKKKKKR